MTLKTTQLHLIHRLANPQDHEAWQTFSTIYYPAIVRSLLLKGVRHQDAEDVAQQVMLSVSRFLASQPFDPDRARFRTLLETITKNAAINAMHAARRDKAVGGTDMQRFLSDIPHDTNDEAILDQEHKKELLRVAANAVRHEFEVDTWQAFWRTMVDGETVEKVAAELGKQAGSVYAARSRVMKRIRVEVGRLAPSVATMLDNHT